MFGDDPRRRLTCDPATVDSHDVVQSEQWLAAHRRACEAPPLPAEHQLDTVDAIPKVLGGDGGVEKPTSPIADSTSSQAERGKPVRSYREILELEERKENDRLDTIAARRRVQPSDESAYLREAKSYLGRRGVRKYNRNKYYYIVAETDVEDRLRGRPFFVVYPPQKGDGYEQIGFDTEHISWHEVQQGCLKYSRLRQRKDGIPTSVLQSLSEHQRAIATGTWETQVTTASTIAAVPARQGSLLACNVSTAVEREVFPNRGTKRRRQREELPRDRMYAVKDYLSALSDELAKTANDKGQRGGEIDSVKQRWTYEDVKREAIELQRQKCQYPSL